MVFRDDAEQAEWIARSVENNLQKDELEPDDILIILPNALTARRQSVGLMEALSRRRISSHLAGVTGSRDVISALGSWVRNTSDHIPGDGNSTSPTRRKLDPEFENSV